MTTQVQQPVEIIRPDPWMADYGTLFEQRHIHPIARGLRAMFFEVKREGWVADVLPAVRDIVRHWASGENFDRRAFDVRNGFLALVVDNIAQRLALMTLDGSGRDASTGEAIEQIAYALWDELGRVAPKMTLEGYGFRLGDLIIALDAGLRRWRWEMDEARREEEEKRRLYLHAKAAYEIASREAKEAEAKWLQATDNYDGTTASRRWADNTLATLKKAEAEKAKAHDEMGFAYQEWMEACEYLGFLGLE